MLKLRREDVTPDHYQVYSGQVRIGTIYRSNSTPGGESWFWGLNGVQNGPGPFNGFVGSLDEAKVDFLASWHDWLLAAGLTEIDRSEPTSAGQRVKSHRTPTPVSRPSATPLTEPRPAARSRR